MSGGGGRARKEIPEAEPTGLSGHSPGNGAPGSLGCAEAGLGPEPGPLAPR